MHIAYHDTQTDLFKQNQKQCGRMFWIPWKPLLSSPPCILHIMTPRLIFSNKTPVLQKITIAPDSMSTGLCPQSTSNQ